jgi:GT2 family glycosyltransferase
MQGHKLAERRGDIDSDMVSRNVVFTPSAVLLRRECFDRVGVFDESIPWMLDYDMWIRIAKEFHFECIKEPLIKYWRVGSDAKKYQRFLAWIKKHTVDSIVIWDLRMEIIDSLETPGRQC